MNHYITYLSGEGDTRTEFSADNPASLAEAKEVFDRIRSKGGSVFRAAPGGQGGERMREFDPHADMIGVPCIVGG